MSTRRLLIGIPMYNEEAAVRPLCAKLDAMRAGVAWEVEVLFVDDASQDHTHRELLAMQRRHGFVRVIRHQQNQGLGGAMQTLFGDALERMRDEDVLITLDGDDTHDPRYIPYMLTLLEREEFDLVIASRFAKGGREVGLHPFRRLLSRGASLFFRLLFPMANVRDYSCGYRAYRVGCLRRAEALWGNLVSVRGFECMAEILVKLRKMGPRAGEYPMVLRYDLKQGRSKMQIMRTIRGYFRLLKLAW